LFEKGKGRRGRRGKNKIVTNQDLENVDEISIEP
jgi:hypothetical protein